MEPEGSSPCSQEPATGFSFQRINLYNLKLFTNFVLIFLIPLLYHIVTNENWGLSDESKGAKKW
jgi:hypothetical protein